MKIYFIRHGQTEHNKDGLLTGQTDVPLNSEGLKEALAAKLQIPDGVTDIYSSDLIRCKQTTEILNENLGLPVTFDSRLRERNFGTLSGRTWEEEGLMTELRSKDKNQQYDYRSYGGESVEDVKKRVLDFILEINNLKKEAKILVVTSGGVLRLLHNLFNGEIHEKINNASFHEFDLDKIFENNDNEILKI